MSAQKYRRRGASGIVTLATWQLRIVWRLLLIEGLGVIVAVTLACAIPFYTQVNSAVDFRASLNSLLNNSSTLTVHGTATRLSPSVIETSTRQIKQLFQHDLGASGAYSGATPGFTIQSPAFVLLTNGHSSGKSISLSGNDFQGQEEQAPALLTGRLPRLVSNANDPIEIALAQTDATQLHVEIGSTLVAKVSFVGSSAMVIATYQQPLTIVGILRSSVGSMPKNVVNALASNTQMQAVFGQLSAQAQAIDSSASLTDSFGLFWSYPLDTSNISITQTNAVSNALSSLLVDIPANVNHPPDIQNVQVQGNVGKLNQYLSKTQAFQLPVTILALQVLALLIFFVAVMAELLVERQATAIALLHSRGASEEQVFGALMLQGVLPGIIALVIGPLLAIGVVYLITQTTLPSSARSVLNLSLPLVSSAMLSLTWFALPTALAAIASMIIAIRRATLTDMLSLRREVTRSMEKPLWQRLYLDVFVALIAVTAYAIATYVTNSGLLDAQSSVLIAAPLEQVAPLFLLIGVLLLVLRLFPLILRLGSLLALRGRGALNMLALSQMARTSGQIIRLTLLLTIAVAFLIFSQVLSASQTRHLSDIADFQVGSDFSGTITSQVSLPLQKGEPPLSYVTRAMAAQAAPYRHIPGVLTASPAYINTLTNQDDGQQVAIRAVDTNTFAQTVTWTAQDSAQPLSTLMAQLADQRTHVVFSDTIPAIVDAAMWNALHLSQGQTFSLSDTQAALNFVAIAEVQSIPTIVDGDTSTGIEGGMLVDYQSYIIAYMTASSNNDVVTLPIHTNYIWLKTTNTATIATALTQLTRIRASLSSGPLQLNPLNDRESLLTQLQQSTSQHNLIAMIAFTAIAPLLLALVGSLLASWMNVRSRLAAFAVLRALGCTPRQIASTLSIELILVYVSALVMGSVLGLILAFQTVPHLVFTDASSAASSAQLFLAQSVPAVRAVIPGTLVLLLGLFLLLCLGTLALMVYIVSSPATAQVLRLNED